MTDRPGPHIEAFIRADPRFEHLVDPQGNDRWWHPEMDSAEGCRGAWKAWMLTAEALKLRHKLNDSGDAGNADG